MSHRGVDLVAVAQRVHEPGLAGVVGEQGRAIRGRDDVVGLEVAAVRNRSDDLLPRGLGQMHMAAQAQFPSEHAEVGQHIGVEPVR